MISVSGYANPINDIIIKTLREKHGDTPFSLLDVASAYGEPSLTLAKAFPHGKFTSTDLADANCKIGPAQAASRGVTNITYESADGQALPYPDQSFDVVTCCMGLMFMPEHKKALSEFRRVLKPGGTLLTTTWGPQDRCQHVRVMSVVVAALGFPSSPLDPCKFGTGEALASDMAAAGFRGAAPQVVVTQVHMPAEYAMSLLMGSPVGAAIEARRAAGESDILERADKELRAAFDQFQLWNADGSVTFKDLAAVLISASA